ncbi:MAG: amidohydrolase family protein, partial [Chloroflexi bacterium]|nr:amidohydrolase family protein [Chloroflexota bacterium]
TYCANLCSAAADRLIGFCVLNPAPGIADGSMARATDLMIEEVRRCYHELGLRGVKMVPAGWYPDDAEVLRLYQVIAELGMYTIFHVGIFLDGKEGKYCRPAFYEGVHQVTGLRVQLAHVGWPWVDEVLAVLAMETQLHGQDPANWQLRTDLSFGPPDDWQLTTWQKAIDAVPSRMLCYGSDVFWPVSPREYREQYLQPQFGLFEVAATNSHIMPEGDPKRAEVRQQIFYDNAWSHFEAAVREPQRPVASERPIATPHANLGQH